jgi:4-amino-4-deoxy-L-arabinose transferase-like glycosyltransferase
VTAKRHNAVWVRALLLALILVTFARVTWALDAKNLWWDESLSLQRAESGLVDLVTGRLIMRDGLSTFPTYDQHPFFFYLALGGLVRLAGTSEYVLRFVSAMAATGLVPAVWVWGRRLARRGVTPVGTGLWATGIAAAHPFFLWYGQEARPYALWALLALLSTYALARALDDGRGWWAGYGVSLLMFLTTHFYAVFLLPVHGLILLVRLWRTRRWLALVAAGAALVVAAGIAVFAYWAIVLRGGGGNFPEVAWSILFPDLLNAFSLGLSVDISRVWPLDLVFAAVALIGAAVCLRSRATWTADGWIPPALVLGPVAVLLVALQVYPAYMNARHMSLIGGGFILLLAAGLAWLGERQRWLPLLPALVMAGGMGVSTVNYFTLEEYAKDDYDSLAAYVSERLAVGDVVLVKPPFSWRIFDYYLPLDAINVAREAGAPVAHYGAPLMYHTWGETEAQIDAWAHEYRRVWLVLSNTHPYQDLERHTEAWMDANLFRVQETIFFSHSSLAARLYLGEIPVTTGLPPDLAQPVDGRFGDLIRLVGVEVSTDPVDGLAAPVTLYWQTLATMPDRYKYILRLEEVGADGATRSIAVTEREPYEGAIPTLYWEPGKTIVEYSELPPTVWPRPATVEDAARYRLTLQVYRGDTLEKLPVTLADGLRQTDDVTLIVADWPTAPAGR